VIEIGICFLRDDNKMYMKRDMICWKSWGDIEGCPIYRDDTYQRVFGGLDES
jgi:hypothetical protein